MSMIWIVMVVSPLTVASTMTWLPSLIELMPSRWRSPAPSVLAYRYG